ncbi:ADP-glyceromanno-heptose 6-epimerase [Paludisphaera rhizosphaerae]|uniref:ADP-glyceromanno-heptose 6-epimerase n=1 Tax=Paludisphaera rhizosphaerae TaxID=2711216 RepID=UPI0013ECB283|nr:ADP-glyceromanno-heptose 6-epimerase [Paludisphaera rhizosphaerae]
MIAITGAAGFIGSNLAHRLSAAGREVLLVDHPLTAATAVNWTGLGRFRFVPMEQFRHDLEKGAGVGIEAVFHLGACSSTTETDWSFLLENNIGYTQALWNWCASEEKPFYYASSAATYGDGSKGFSDRTPPTDLEPLNLYGKSKNDFDVWALNEIAEGRPQPPAWAGLKFFNVYGPREIHKGKMASVVWHARRQILETGEVRLFRSNDPAFPDGGQRRDFVFVEDCIDHMLWLWANPRVSGIFNSGTGTSRTFQDLATAVFTALGREPRIQFIDMPPELGRQYQNYTQADMSKLRGAGYAKPATTLEEGVKQTLSWKDAP